MGWRVLAVSIVWCIWCVFVTCTPAMAADISILPDSPKGVPIILVSGAFEEGDDKTFAQTALPLDGAIVLFDSPGGNLLAGIGIGKAIRLKEFVTAVGDNGTCASACGLAWLGGIKRLAQPGARIGFHAAFIEREGAATESGAANALVGAYLNQLGMSQTAVVYLTSAPPDGMQWLPLSEAAQHGIDLEVIAGSDTPGPASPPSPQPEPSAAMSRLDGFDVLGFDLPDMPLRDISREDCEAACGTRTVCKAYTYNIRKRVCFLKSGGKRVLENATAVAGVRPEIKDSLFVSPLTIMERTDLPGNDIAKLSISDFDQCLAACEGDRRCKAFTFVKRSAVCWIKSAAGPPLANKRAVSGVRSD